MAITQTAPSRQQRTSFLNDPVIRGITMQVVVAVLVIGFFLWIANNAAINLAAQNKTSGFDFLWKTSGFAISFTLFPFSRSSFYWEAYLVGLTNTLLVASIGIVVATALGFLLGVSRLSSNFIVSRLATIYIEVVRNTPLLLQLFFWYFAVLKAMPAVRDSLALPLGIFINQRGLFIPKPIPSEGFGIVWIALAIGIIGAFILKFWAKRRLETTGKRFPTLLASIALIVGLTAIAWLASGASLTFDMPVLNRFNFKGGIELPPELVAMVWGLSIYTAAFIGETVRAGIKSVSRGQTEAAQSLGIKEGDRLRLVIIPQAMRVIVPPLTSQYLNLTKNSSLGAAIGYPELVNVFAGTSLNQTGRAIEIIAITMLTYGTFSLLTSLFMNWYNSRVKLVER